MTLPHPESPLHVANLASVELLKSQDWDGPDASLVISLAEYGLAWRETKTEWQFIYRIREGRFDRCSFAKDTVPAKEWNFVEWADVSSFTGQTVEDLQSMPFPLVVDTLLSYYGFENIFGSSYWEGFAIAGLE